MESICQRKSQKYLDSMDFATLEHWVNINSGSGNANGLRIMADALQEHLSKIPGEMERIRIPACRNLDGKAFQPGDVLRLRFRPEAPLRVLFSGHMDTVFGEDHPFQRLRRLADGRLNGPGVTDMKGGLYILIEAVTRFLEEDAKGILGGEILITADEEVGSVGSRDLLLEAAASNRIGLVFESALPGGELVRARRGTGTFRFSARGKSAHTGRDFEKGRNAVVALASMMLRIHSLNGTIPGAIFNVGSLRGGGPVNVVPDHAEAWLNVRIAKPESAVEIREVLRNLLEEEKTSTDGIRMEMVGEFTRLPATETPANAALHDMWNETESSLGLPISGKRDTGGSSDGNIFSEAGLPYLDGVGVRGGAIHSEEEFAIPESIPGQIDKTVAFLHRLSKNPGCLEQPPFQRRSDDW